MNQELKSKWIISNKVWLNYNFDFPEIFFRLPSTVLEIIETDFYQPYVTIASQPLSVRVFDVAVYKCIDILWVKVQTVQLVRLTIFTHTAIMF